MDIVTSAWAWGALLLIAAAALLWFAAPLWLWLITGGSLLTGFTFIADAGLAATVSAWVAFIVPVVVFGVPTVRREVLTERILRRFRQFMPELSRAEQDALEVGGIGWEGELFSGAPRWRQLLAREPAGATSEEREFLDGAVERLCTDLEVAPDARRGIPPETWQRLREEGFLGLSIPAEHGGRGLGDGALAAVYQKIASRNMGVAMALAAANTAGPVRLLHRYGTPAQRETWLTAMARGEQLVTLAVTAREAGSDPSATPDLGTVCRRGGQIGLRLDFDKRYISLAPVADQFIVAFKLLDPDGLVDSATDGGLTLALVAADAPGVQHGSRYEMAQPGADVGPVRGKDVFVPMDDVIGGVGGVGRGWTWLLECLADSRGLALPALAAGATKLASRATGAYARARYQFHEPIGTFEGVQAALADVGGLAHGIDAARQLLLAERAADRLPVLSAAAMKFLLAERSRHAINRAQDVFAGAGLCEGPSNPLGRLARFPAMAIAADGPNIMTRSRVVFGQAALRCHPFLNEEIAAAAGQGTAGLTSFDRVMARHLRFFVRNLLRSFVHGLTRGWLVRTPRRTRNMGRYFRRASRLCAGYALTVDVLLLVAGGDLRHRQRVSARMAVILAELYLMSAVLWTCLQRGSDDKDDMLTRWALDDSFDRLQSAYRELFANFPSPWAARLLRLAVFPLGMRFSRPSDADDTAVANIQMVPSSSRDRLTHGIYLPTDEAEQLARLENALGRLTLTAPLRSKLREGARFELVQEGPFEGRLQAAVEARLLTPDEAEQLRQAEAVRLAVLRVDEID